MFKPTNALEILTIRAFLSYLDKGYGILPLWTPEECLYYTLLSIGLVNEGNKYKEFLGKDRKYRQPWKYYWKVDWNVKEEDNNA